MDTKPNLPQIAAQRGRQTLWQGLAVAVTLAILTALVAGLTAGSWAEWLASWQVWTYSAFQAAVTAGVAWAVRMWGDHSGYHPDGTPK